MASSTAQADSDFAGLVTLLLGDRPRILGALALALLAYLEDASVLPGLNLANGSSRQQRRERRVACILLLCATIRYLDLASLRVGIPKRDGTFRHLTLAFLAKSAGMSLRRAERALSDLQRAGIMTVRRRCTRDEAGNYTGLAAHKFVAPALFGVFRLGKWLGREREKARLRQQRRETDHRKSQRGDPTRANGKLMALAALGGRRRRPAAPVVNAGHDFAAEAHSRALQLRAAHYYALHPDRGRDWAYARARAELTP